jgi:hypothetical protein
MDLEEKKVLLKQRFNPFVSSRKKEWWYTGVVDDTNRIFLGFSVIRVMFMDSISIGLFDAKNPETILAEWKGYLDSDNPQNRLSLKAKSKKFTFDYTGSGTGSEGWKAEISSDTISASLEIKPTISPFTKFDNLFVDEYTLLHFFMNRVNGSVTTRTSGSGKTYTITDALGYYDHCFGTVPKKTKWHWIAVQSQTCALASLMNYGTYAQCYTEVYFTVGAAPESAQGRWIRLDQDVSFECYHHDRFTKHWRVTSPDMALKLVVIQAECEEERIPPLVPFLVNLDHWQCSVNVSGWIRVDGEWIETGDLHGVFEEHNGTW